MRVINGLGPGRSRTRLHLPGIHESLLFGTSMCFGCLLFSRHFARPVEIMFNFLVVLSLIHILRMSFDGFRCFLGALSCILMKWRLDVSTLARNAIPVWTLTSVYNGPYFSGQGVFSRSRRFGVWCLHGCLGAWRLDVLMCVWVDGSRLAY